MTRSDASPPERDVVDLRRIGSRWSAASRLGDFIRSGFFRRVVLPLLIAVIGLKLVIALSVTYVRPNEYGIKVVRVPILGQRGVHTDVYQTGFHLVLKPFDLEEMYLFPKDLQVIDLAGARQEEGHMTPGGKAAHIQTSDGFFVDVDVSILYKIVDPYLVFTRLGTGRLFETNGIVLKAEPVLKQTLGELTTKDADRDLYVRRKRAEADLLAKLAEAKKTQLRNDALQGAGSDRMVGLKMADVYKGLEIIVLPSDGANGVNPLNLEQSLKLFEVKKEGRP